MDIFKKITSIFKFKKWRFLKLKLSIIINFDKINNFKLKTKRVKFEI